MRATVKTHPSHNAKLAPLQDFFARDSHRRHIPRKEAIRVPSQGFDPVACIAWLIIIPIAAAIGWYGFIKLAIAFLSWSSSL